MMRDDGWEGPRGNPTDARLTRRELLIGVAGGAAGALVGGVAGWFARGSQRTGWPGAIVLGDAEQLLDEIVKSGAPLIRPDTWSPTIAVIRWDPSLPGALHVYPEPDHGVLDDDNGLMTLDLRDPHLGCRVEWCPTSQWFENPCHGEKFNRWGEWMDGPPPKASTATRPRSTADGTSSTSTATSSAPHGTPGSSTRNRPGRTASTDRGCRR